MSDNSTMDTPADTNEIQFTAIPAVKLLLVLLLRAGSLIVQLGTFPTDRVYNIISQNIIDISVTITSFLFVGLPLYSSINNFNGFFGYGTWIGSDDADVETGINGVCACLIGTHIITSLLSGRLHTKASIVVYSIYSGIILPITMHWAWNDNGWTKHNNILNTNVSFIDNNGAIVIHCSAGLSALIGSLFLGRRLLRLKDLDESSLSIGSPGITVVGYFFITFGIIGISLPSENFEAIFMVIVNSALALSLSISTVFSLTNSERTSYWELMQCFQGGIGALVMLSAGIEHYTVTKTFLLAIISSIVFTVSVKIINLSPLEDYGNITSIHVINGLIAIFIPNIWNYPQHNVWQLVCSVVILTVHAVSFTLIFSLLTVCGVIRNKNDELNHKRSQNLVKNMKTASWNRIFRISGRSVILQPGKSRKVPEVNASAPTSYISIATNTTTSDTVLEERREGVISDFAVNNEKKESQTVLDVESVVYKLQDLIDESKETSKEKCSV